MKDAIDLIQAEIGLAIKKHGQKQTPLSHHMCRQEKLMILVEELGEVARAMTYDNYNPENLRSELCQVATMAAAWLQAEIEMDITRMEAFRKSTELCDFLPPNDETLSHKESSPDDNA